MTLKAEIRTTQGEWHTTTHSVFIRLHSVDKERHKKVCLLRDRFRKTQSTIDKVQNKQYVEVRNSIAAFVVSKRKQS